VAIASHFLKFQAQAAINTLISSPICPLSKFLASRQVVGWSLSKHPNAQLAQDAMNNAIARHKPNTSNSLIGFNISDITYPVSIALLLVKVTIKQIVCRVPLLG
jgi:hypothetical protein